MFLTHKSMIALLVVFKSTLKITNYFPWTVYFWQMNALWLIESYKNDIEALIGTSLY